MGSSLSGARSHDGPRETPETKAFWISAESSMWNQWVTNASPKSLWISAFRYALLTARGSPPDPLSINKMARKLLILNNNFLGNR
jgi:hypothetical protein